METIVAQRIRNSRIHKNLSLQQVADAVGVSKQMISKYEKGESMPGSEKIIQLSQLFQQKPDYFFRRPEVELGTINFRKKSTFGAKKVNALKEEVRMQVENYIAIENILNLKNDFKNPLKNFKIETNQDIKDASNKLKEIWDIGKDALHNIIELFEEKMIKVIEVDEDSNKFDGLATVIDEIYYIIVVNKNFGVERKRFTLLHELGHLLLDIQHFEEKQQEKFCHLFASEMLLSSENILLEFGNHRSRVTFQETYNIQEKYGISFRAIVYKLEQNKIINKNRIESFYKMINSDRSLRELVDVSRFKGIEHSSRYESLVFRAVAEEVISISKAAAFLNKKMVEMKDVLNFNIG